MTESHLREARRETRPGRQPAISVIVPTHLRQDYLRQALASVLAQTLADFECIVVGDVPHEAEAIRSIIESHGDTRFSYRLNSDDPGGNGSRNLGLRESRAPYVAFLDDDDWWEPTKLARHHAVHIETGAALVFSNARIVFEPGAIAGGQWRAPGLIADPVAWLVGGSCPATSTIVTVRRDVLEKSGLFDPELVSVQDWDLWMRVAEHGSFATITEPLANFRQHQSERTSRDPSRRLEGIRQIERKWGARYDITQFIDTMRATVAIDQARMAIASGRKWAGLKSGLANLWKGSFKFALRNRLRTSLELLAASLR